MNEEIFKGKWNQVKGEIQKEWGKLTHNDVDKVQGEMKILEGMLQEKYGHTKEEAKSKLENFLKKFN